MIDKVKWQNLAGSRKELRYPKVDIKVYNNDEDGVKVLDYTTFVPSRNKKKVNSGIL